MSLVLNHFDDPMSSINTAKCICCALIWDCFLNVSCQIICATSVFHFRDEAKYRMGLPKLMKLVSHLPLLVLLFLLWYGISSTG